MIQLEVSMGRETKIKADCIVCGVVFDHWLDMINHAEIHYFDGSIIKSLPTIDGVKG